MSSHTLSKLLAVLSVAMVWLHAAQAARTFELRDDKFMRDGKPFRVKAGCIHYFRIDPSYWSDRLQRVRAMGLNAIEVYVPWNYHCPSTPDQCSFTGGQDLVGFLAAAQDADLVVLLRLGPYICGEWDGGGLPGWLWNHAAVGAIRTNDTGFMHYTSGWWGQLLPLLTDNNMLYSQGGPVVMAQVENEFGSYGNVAGNPADRAYMEGLVSLARQYLGESIILYTTDGGSESFMSRGSLNGSAVYTVGDFGPGSNPKSSFRAQKLFNPPGMRASMVSEFYSGWLTHWGEAVANTSATAFANGLDLVLRDGGSVAIYMAHGGTNFGLWNGANGGGASISPVITSYDYNAQIAEDGRHNIGSDGVDKYAATKAVLTKWAAKDGDGPIPAEKPFVPVSAFGNVTVDQVGSIIGFGSVVKQLCPSFTSAYPLPTFSELGVFRGMALFTHSLSHDAPAGGNITLPGLRDRAVVLVNGTRVGSIYRDGADSLVLPARSHGTLLDILVESVGRINYGNEEWSDTKGLTGGVFLDGQPVPGSWLICRLPLDEIDVSTLQLTQYSSSMAPSVPAFFRGQLSVSGPPTDTFLWPSGWGKGFLWVNGRLAGRYWDTKGPQHTLYVPASWLQEGSNEVVLLELDQTPPPADLASSIVTRDAPVYFVPPSCTPAPSPQNGGNVVTFGCSEARSASQQWQFDASDGSVRLTQAPHLCLTSGPGSDPDSGFPSASVVTCGDSTDPPADQAWQPSGGQLVLAGGSDCLDVTNHLAADGANVETYPCNGGSNQQWSVPTSVGGPIVGLGGRCLTVCG